MLFTFHLEHNKKRAIINNKGERGFKMKKFLLTSTLLTASMLAINPGFAQQNVEQAIGNLNSQDNETRMEGIRLLTNVDTERATEGLISGVNNPDETVRYLAIYELTQRAKESESKNRAIEGLISGLNSSDNDIRKRAVKGLAESDTERSTEGLINALNNSCTEVQNIAISALAKRAQNSTSKERATEGLISALNNLNTDIRIISVKTLSILPSQRAKEGLKHALNDQDSRVRQIAQESLK